ncbi:hypothetical protein [Oceanivirga salmonicida]|uniref:hypothetical protein n=1 Tax=Oceanivirga salmonicida TaxID=1769291 RepID=UPI0008329970|nr:hypothetical protein [Oceanivirga salmonicida]
MVIDELKKVKNIKNFAILMSALILLTLSVLLVFYEIIKNNYVSDNIYFSIVIISLMLLVGIIMLYLNFYLIIKKTYNEKLSINRMVRYVLLLILWGLIITVSVFFISVALAYIVGFWGLVTILNLSTQPIIIYKSIGLRFSAYSKIKISELEKFSEYMWSKNKKMYYLLILMPLIISILNMAYSYYFIYDILGSDSFDPELLNSKIFLFKIFVPYLIYIPYSYLQYCINVDIYGSYLEFEKEKNIEISE